MLFRSVIGTTKFAYDLWGETVNTASRLEAHGVSGKIHDDPFVPQTDVFYSAGALILSNADPSQVIARTPEPLLVPETPDELVGTVGNVVFPTAIESIEGMHYVFYGMADAKIGVARLERT